MFSYDLTDVLRKKLKKLAKNDKVLAGIVHRKVQEIVHRNQKTIHSYKNLRSPMNASKRIHLTDNFILIFAVHENHIIFVDIKHWDTVYSGANS